MTFKSTIANKKNRKTIAFIIVGVLFLFTFTTITGGQRNYQIKPEVEIPEYKTDNTRMIETYVRLMDRYMDLVEKNLGAIDLNIKNTAKSLERIDKNLNDLSIRIARIEKAMGIEEPQSPITVPPDIQVQNSKGSLTKTKQ